MTATITMDRAGRVVIPRAIRERFGLTGATHQLEIVESPDGIVLRPAGAAIPATRDPGGWIVFHSKAAGATEPLDPVALVEAERARRQRHVAGK